MNFNPKKMKKYFLLLVNAVLLATVSCGTGDSGRGYMVVGYVAGFRDYDIAQIDASGLTHINYAFANIIGGKVRFGNDSIDDTRLNEEDLGKLVSLRKDNAGLKILVSVGGWSWSGCFSDAALTDSSRTIFSESAAAFIRDYRLDGIDLDWEYPNQEGAGNVFRPDDVHNFTLMVQCVRRHIDSLAREEGRTEPYLLTIATGADEVYAANTELGELARYLDFINIMTYDLHNGLTTQTGHHSNLHVSDSDTPGGDALEKAVEIHLKAGVPPSKINIGIPFYGRRWKGVEPVNKGLYREAATGGAAIPYTLVLEAEKDPAFTRYYDSSAAAPFLWNASDSVFISYDDAVSITGKTDYVRQQGLGGVMFWEYTEDIDGMLLKTIVEGLHKEQYQR